MPHGDIERLSRATLDKVRPDVELPGYQPDNHGTGIVHIGLGAFHRAHQAIYTDTALATSGGNWRIAALSMRSTKGANDLSGQNGLFSVVTKSLSGSSTRIVASIAKALALRNDRQEINTLLCDPDIRIISLTVTEKGYCYDPSTLRLDTKDPAIAKDIAAPNDPVSVPGLLVWALDQRRKKGLPGLSILSCDNLPNNGELTKTVVSEFAALCDPELAKWIEANVTFPSTMVDRITPEANRALVEETQTHLGLMDLAPVQAEPFSQWVIEDTFQRGRPDWESGGAIMTDDVVPYEKMKLRMLNGSHSILAYAGYISGHETIRDCVENPTLRGLFLNHLAEVTKGLPNLPGVDYQDYSDLLLKRFENPAIRHNTYQIAMDGSLKMPQRIFEPAIEAIERSDPIHTYSFATAAWFRYLMGKTESGRAYSLQDPRAAEISEALSATQTCHSDTFAALLKVGGLLPSRLFQHEIWRNSVHTNLQAILEKGVIQAATVIGQ